MAAVTGQIRKWLRHEGSTHAVFFGNVFHHVFEENVTVAGFQNMIIFPVHFPLTIRVFVVVLVSTPFKLDHGITNFRDHIKATHQGALVITGLFHNIAIVINP